MSEKMTEAEMCEAFAALARSEGWTVYPETCGWDMLLVRDADGAQVGVEAKLRASYELLCQALPAPGDTPRPGPDWRAVLVPKVPAGFRRVCDHLRIVVLSWDQLKNAKHYRTIAALVLPRWYRHDGERHTLPSIVPSGVGGHPSPRVFSEWREKALRLVIIGRRRGYLTGRDFTAIGQARSTWVQRGWMRRTGMERDAAHPKRGYARYELVEDAKGFPATGWEDEVQALERADAETEVKV